MRMGPNGQENCCKSQKGKYPSSHAEIEIVYQVEKISLIINTKIIRNLRG